ncbi:hypothetical protein G6F26_011539 [Rhizopus arrhizus]|nr:hypothetical protein G6F19_011886 [Rhizopus arrhizus]KAG0891160.1 hypothetical protein G6F34_011903 [Rhizopus arrhizus]KAG0930147.1 hypothetical protein G6F30_011743 [Rhizopus arrhizus]KAG1002327.1 hypothetical protein G6F27_012061 [Rhizopus arrhizus]KAG1017688.1 hypothetical protein G6F26_011539 [Rhizopus arrhizus]
MDRNVTDHKTDTSIDSFELYVEDNSNEDFQSVVTARKRKRMENIPQSGSQKRLKVKGKATDSEVTSTSSTGISTTDEPPMFYKITFDDYGLEYSSGDFDAPAIKRLFLGESTKSAFRITKSTSAIVESSTTASKTSLTSPRPSKHVPTTFNSAATSVKSSFCPVPIDKASVIKEGPKKISKRVMTIKTTLKNIWKPAYLQSLHDLVRTTNLLVIHTFAFIKYIYLQELAANENFALNHFVTKDIFVEVFLSLVLSKEAYFEDAGYTPSNLPYAQQIALLRGLINKLFKKKEKAESLRGEMQANKSSSKTIKEATREKIYRPCNQVKLAIAKKEMPEVGFLDDQSRTQLNGFLSSYPEDYTFQKNSIYYDVMASPKNHFKAFFRLAESSEAEQTKQFACFPLRTTFIPCYMTLDSKIIHHHVLKSKKNPKTGSKFETWGAVVDLNKKAFKHQGFQKSLRFQGTLETDGVGVSIIKQNTDTSRNSLKPNIEKKMDGNQTENIEELGQADLKSTEGKCVLIDPGRRDLMHCMKETSTVKEKQTLIFIKNNRSKCSRRFRYLRKRTQPFVVQKVETILSRSESNSVNLKKFVQYIKTRASVKKTLYEYYENETTKSKETYFPESEFDFRVDQKCNLYYGNLFIARIRDFFPQPENYSTDSFVKSQLYTTYLQTLLKQKHISERLDDSEKSKILVLAKEMNRRS